MIKLRPSVELKRLTSVTIRVKISLLLLELVINELAIGCLKRAHHLDIDSPQAPRDQRMELRLTLDVV